MADPVRVERQTGRYERKREAILDAAARLFNQKGLKGATLADVAQSVGLITTSVTYYYRKKEDLAAACLMRTMAAFEGLIDAAEAAPTPQQRLAEFLHRYFALLAEIAEGTRPELINFYDVLALTGRHAEPVYEAFNRLFRRIRQLFRADGDVPVQLQANDGVDRGHPVFSKVCGRRVASHGISAIRRFRNQARRQPLRQCRAGAAVLLSEGSWAGA